MREARREVIVRAAGIRLRAVVDVGGADGARPILVLHGFTGSAESMRGVAERLTLYRTVVRLELVGHGGSEAPRDRAFYTMEACAQQIVVATAQLGLERPHLLGYSMGGRAALATVVEYPEAFASLTLVGATAGIEDGSERRARISADEALADRIECDGVEAFVDAWMALPLFATQARLGPEALAAARAERLRNRAHGLANSLRGMGAGAQPPLHDRIDRVDLPTLWLAGAEDEKFRRLSTQLAASMRRGRVEIVPDVGHAVALEAPEAFARIVERFLESVDCDRDHGRRGGAESFEPRRGRST